MRALLAVIIITTVTILTAGCGNDQYAVEKRYWQVQRQAQRIYRNPEGSPPNELKRIVENLNNFAARNARSALSVEAEFHIARLYLVKKEYTQSRQQLNKIFDKYKSDIIRAEVLFLLGQSYQLEESWDAALGQYKKIMQGYPLTPRGIDVPIYIAQYYKVKFQPDKRIAAIQEAITHYKALAAQYPGTPLAYTVSNLVTTCFVSLKDWDSAIANIDATIAAYKEKVWVDRLLLDKALIYSRELKDKLKAQEVLEQLIKEYPKSRLVNTAKSLLKNLEKK